MAKWDNTCEVWKFYSNVILAGSWLSEMVLTHHCFIYYTPLHTPQSFEHKSLDGIQNVCMLGPVTGNNLPFLICLENCFTIELDPRIPNYDHGVKVVHSGKFCMSNSSLRLTCIVPHSADHHHYLETKNSPWLNTYATSPHQRFCWGFNLNMYEILRCPPWLSQYFLRQIILDIKNCSIVFVRLGTLSTI